MDGITLHRRQFSLALSAPICSPYVLLWCSSVFVSRLCQKLCSASAIIVKGGKLTQTFHSIYMSKKPVPLSHSKSLKEFTTNLRDKLVSSKPLIGIETPSLESAEKPPQTQKILRLPQQVHGLHVSSPQPLTAKDCCSLGIYRRDSVRALGYH